MKAYKFVMLSTFPYLDWFCVAFTLVMVACTLTCERIIAQAEARSETMNSKLWWGTAFGKTSASVGFLALYGLSISQIDSAQHRVHPYWLGAALFASAVGDVALIGRSERSFLMGLGAFLLAHLAFMVAFAFPENHDSFQNLNDPWFWKICAVALLVSGSASVFAYRLFKPFMSIELRIPSLVYASVIALMVATATAHSYYYQCTYVAIGAIAFWLSDLAVARQRFQGDQLPLRGFSVRLWGLPLYYVAQLILAAEPSRALW